MINAQNGIEMMTGRFMQWAAKRGLDRLVIVNRIDAENVDLPALLEKIQQAFGKECLPLNLPAAGASKVSDCFFAPSGEADFSSVEEAHRKLVEQVVEVDEKLMEVYLEKGEVAPEALHEPLERAMREGHLIPVVFTSAKTGAGVGELLDVIVKLLPNPAEGNPPVYVNIPAGGGEATDIIALPDPGRACARPRVQGRDRPLYRAPRGVPRAPGTHHAGNPALHRRRQEAGQGRAPLRAQGARHRSRSTKRCRATSAPSPRSTTSASTTFCTTPRSDAHIHAKPLELPIAVFGLAVQPKKRGDEQKVSDVLHKLMAEDPCFRLEHNAQANETVMRGIGELHLKVMLEKMATQYKVELDTRPPSIPYRETIAARAEGHSRHKKQTGGAGQFGEVFLRIEPLPRGTGFEFIDKVKGGVIPNQFIPAVEKGVRGVLQTGFIAGYPMQDLRVTVYDGKYHPVDSKEVAFVSAGRKAFIDALGKARPIVLEPIVNVDVIAPEQKMGDIAGELSGHRGHIKGSDAPRPGTVQILAQAPLSELEQFPARLKSLTAGHGSYTLEFSHYDPAPPLLQQRLAAAHRPAAHADD